MSDTPGLRIEDAMLGDRRELRRLRQSIKNAKRRGKPFDRNERRYEQLLRGSVEQRATREANRPAIVFDADLPVLDRADEIRAAIVEHPVLVLCGETGSGKSTQLPKLCLNVGRGVAGIIGHTQPRRVAARSVAARIAQELGSKLGEHVGYKVRFQDETAASTYIKLMTDGVLLAEAQSDRRLERYDTLIIDEAHERSLNIDLLLGLLRQLTERRPELRVIITSATIDAERFAEFFGRGDKPAPVIEVSGRTYPVDLRYDEPAGDVDPLRAVVDAVFSVQAEHSGDTLVFLPTERDIREAARLLRGASRSGGGFEVTPLYARLSAAEQQRVFEPGKRRRVVLATNVAESSVTVPRIGSVVDTGLARIARYSPQSRVQRLPIEPVSQASADQRAGRCGRIGPGLCVRLYSERDYDKRAQYTAPEIRRTDLAAVVLRMLTIGLGSIEEFPLLDRPKPEAVRAAYATLRELQAIDDEGGLTTIGKQLGRMPVDPRVGRMILAAQEEDCLADVLILAAALETQDPRLRPAEWQDEADRLHKRFADGRSDFVSYLNLWDHLEEMRSSLSRSTAKRECERQHLSNVRIWEWRDVHRQLRDIARQNGLRIGERSNSYGAIHRSLLTGLLSGVALLRGEEGYQTAGGEGFQLWPGAGPAPTKPKWVVAAEVVETSRRYLRTVARIRPEWVPRLADHVAERSYRPPQWSDDQQTVVAQERRTLYGLPISGRRTVCYGSIDPVASREVFIDQALVGERLRGDWPFLEHNRKIVERLRVEGAKSRSPHELVADGGLTAFYEGQIPADVYDTRSFRRWYRKNRSTEDDPLCLADPAGEADYEQVDAHAYPDTLDVAGNEVRITYVHDRSRPDDGATLHVPAPLVGVLDAQRLEWLVPGFLAEKIAALIKTLPKQLRTRLTPAPDTAARVAPSLRFGEGAFLPVLGEALSDEAQATISAEDFAVDQLPERLRYYLRVIDSEGACVVEGREIEQIQSEVAKDARSDIGRFADDSARVVSLDTDWQLPESVVISRDGFDLTAYPGLLIDESQIVERRFVEQNDALDSTDRALRRIAFLQLEAKLREQVVWLPDWDTLVTALRPTDASRDLETEVAQLLAARCLPDDLRAVRDAESLAKTIEQAADSLPETAASQTQFVVRTLTAAAAVSDQLKQLGRAGPAEIVNDLRERLHELAPIGFLLDTPADWRPHLARYLRALEARMKRLAQGGESQDRRMTEQIRPHAERLAAAEEGPAGESRRAAVTLYRWMLEEYRVSVFAQQLGTSIKVSAKRLDEQWSRVKQS